MAAWAVEITCRTIVGIALSCGLLSCGGDDGPRPQPACLALPDTLDFGAVLLDTSDTLAVTIENAGKLPLTLSPKLELGLTPADPTESSLAGVDSAGLSVPPDSTAEFSVVFVPYTTGAKAAWLDLAYSTRTVWGTRPTRRQ